MGIRRICDWNSAAIEKYVWDIASKKDNLFVKWVHSVYIPEEDWWEYKPKGEVSWYWKKIVAVKAMIKNFSDLQQFVAEKYEIQKWYYKFYNEQRQVVSWCSSVWDRLNMHKHRIILWLV